MLGTARAAGGWLLALWPALAGFVPEAQSQVETRVRTLDVAVFLDENHNGALDASEPVRLPGAVVEIGDQSARTEGSGHATLNGLPPGTYTVRLRPDSLPPFFEPPGVLRVTLPLDEGLAIPVTLPVGPNQASVYLAFGDSITDGEGSSDENGYRSVLEGRLRAHFGAGRVQNDGVAGASSAMGVRRIRQSLAANRPGYALILIGTNDWASPACRASLRGCETLEHLTRIVRHVKSVQSLPFLATLPPVNEGFSDDAPHERGVRLAEINEQIRSLAAREGAVLVDVHAAFVRSGEPRSLFADAVHPNGAGYERIAQAFFDAIAGPTRAAAELPSTHPRP